MRPPNSSMFKLFRFFLINCIHIQSNDICIPTIHIIYQNTVDKTFNCCSAENFNLICFVEIFLIFLRLVNVTFFDSLKFSFVFKTLSFFII